MFPVCIQYTDFYTELQLFLTVPSINKLVPPCFCHSFPFQLRSGYSLTTERPLCLTNYPSLCDKCTHALSPGVEYGETELKMGSVSSYFGQLCGNEKQGGEYWRWLVRPTISNNVLNVFFTDRDATNDCFLLSINLPVIFTMNILFLTKNQMVVPFIKSQREPKVTSLNRCFCPTNGPKSKRLFVYFHYDKEKQNVELNKLEQGNVWPRLTASLLQIYK